MYQRQSKAAPKNTHKKIVATTEQYAQPFFFQCDHIFFLTTISHNFITIFYHIFTMFTFTNSKRKQIIINIVMYCISVCFINIVMYCISVCFCLYLVGTFTNSKRKQIIINIVMYYISVCIINIVMYCISVCIINIVMYCISVCFCLYLVGTAPAVKFVKLTFNTQHINLFLTVPVLVLVLISHVMLIKC